MLANLIVKVGDPVVHSLEKEGGFSLGAQQVQPPQLGQSFPLLFFLVEVYHGLQFSLRGLKLFMETYNSLFVFVVI